MEACISHSIVQIWLLYELLLISSWASGISMVDANTKQILARWRTLDEGGGLRRATVMLRILGAVGLLLIAFVRIHHCVYTMIRVSHPPPPWLRDGLQPSVTRCASGWSSGPSSRRIWTGTEFITILMTTPNMHLSGRAVNKVPGLPRRSTLALELIEVLS